MQMLMARCMGALCALMISGCTLVEQIGALSGDQDAAVPALSGLETHADWTSPEDQENTPAPSVRVPRTTGDDAVPRPKTKPEIVDPKALVGLDKQSIELIFGLPHHITLAQPATVWAWEQDGCRMRLFFYPDLTAQKFRALAYEISANQPKNNAMLIETCASRIKWANAETTSK
tara:strand:- start:3304 stop:3828 length:525 start_codon:yes stop_codon:yes gene_type:complete